MFGRKRQRAQQAISEAELTEIAARFEKKADEWVAVSPTTFPDGVRYPADAHLHNLARLAAYFVALDWPESEALVGRTVMLMAMVRDADRDGPTVETLGALLETRQFLTERGLHQEAAVLAAASTDVGRYYEQSGASDRLLDQLDDDRSSG